MLKREILLLQCLLFFCLFSNSCLKKDSQPQKPIVLVTIAPYAYALEKICGDTIQIATLVPPQINVHVFEPSPRLVEKQQKAIAWFRIGESLESKAVSSLQEKNPKQKIVNLQEGLALLKQEEHSCHGDHSHTSYDLHTWLSPKIFLIQCKKMKDILLELLPHNKELYEKNFELFASELENLSLKIKDKLYLLKGAAILTSHPAFGYFCQEFSLKQIAVECEGKDPRPKDIERIFILAKMYPLRCVFLQQGYNNRGALLIGEQLHLPIYQVDPYAEDYLKNMEEITEKITG